MMETKTSDFISIVSGLPRSGTSMMMQMLNAARIPILTDQARAADEDNPRGYYELEKVKTIRDDASWLGAARGRAFKMVSMLLYALPRDHEYKVVFMRRELAEVVASQATMLRRLGRPADNMPDSKVKELYARHLDDVARWLSARADIKVLSIEYADVIRDPVRVAERVGTFLDVRERAADMAAAVDAKLYRNQRSGRTPEAA